MAAKQAMKKPKMDPKLSYQKVTGQYMTSSMRAKFREGVDLVLPNLISLGKGEVSTAPHSVQVRAADTVAKYAIGERPIMMFEHNEWLAIVARVTAEFINDPATFEKWRFEVMKRFAVQL